MKIANAAQASGLAAHTIRFYEKSGMLPDIARGPDGHRRFSTQDIDWLTLLASLRETGMPVRTMTHFARLYRQGDTTVAERKEILGAHQADLEGRQRRLIVCRDLLGRKIARYDEIIGEKT